MGHRLGADLPRLQSGFGTYTQHRRRKGEGKAAGQFGPLLLSGQRRMDPQDARGTRRDELRRRRRTGQRQLRFRIPPHLLFRDGRELLVSDNLNDQYQNIELNIPTKESTRKRKRSYLVK